MNLEFYSGKWVKTKKEHKCEFCTRSFPKDTKMFYEAGKYCGDFFTRYLCDICYEYYSEWCCEVDNEFTWEDIREYIQAENCESCIHHESCNHNIFNCDKLRKQYIKEDKQNE